MRKLILALFVCLLAGSCFGQRISNDTLYIDTLAFVKGQNITLGEGSNMATKEFNFITSAPSSFIPQSKLPSNWNGLQMTIKGFKYLHSKRGEKYGNDILVYTKNTKYSLMVENDRFKNSFQIVKYLTGIGCKMEASKLFSTIKKNALQACYCFRLNYYHSIRAVTRACICKGK